MTQQRDLTFRQMVDLSFGFLGVQIAYALQSANISRIFATLGADPHQLSFFWILPPLMGMIVQPLIGKYSDRTWCKMGRRKPYLIVGAVIAVLVMLFLPNAGSLHFSTRLFLGLNMAMWFGLFSLIFLDTSINVAMQPFKMMVGDMVNEKQKTTAYSIQSFLCNAGSLLGYLFPIFFTWIGIANEAPEGVVPDSVVYSFYVGAAILILCVLYTFLRVKEMPPKEYAEFHGIDLQNQEKKSDKGLMKLLVEMVHKELPDLMEKNVKLVVIGNINRLPDAPRTQLQHAIDETANNTGMQLNLAISYGGRLEIVDACKAIAKEVQEGKLSLDAVDESVFAKHLYLKGAPDPDLVIRTGGEFRLSNYLLWQAAYSEFYVTPTLWPDFTNEEFQKAIDFYNTRERRFGKVLHE